jgi:hypothetical protein
MVFCVRADGEKLLALGKLGPDIRGTSGKYRRDGRHLVSFTLGTFPA